LCLHHAERLVEDGLTRLTVISDLDETLGNGKSTTIWILVNGNASPEGKLDEYAAA
jgi:hypothetical protein